jgi:alpha,alpha-trehalase
MRGVEKIKPGQPAMNRVVLMKDGSILNRYWDENNSPRPESYKEDIELSHQSSQVPEALFRNLRAAAESGWDFSSRWFKDVKSFATIHTTDIIPIDLNCLLVHLEQVLSDAQGLAGNKEKSDYYAQLVNRRKSAIEKYCWNKDKGFYFDYDFAAGQQKEQLTLAAAFPLFFNIATQSQASAVEKIIRHDFLKVGGVTTTLEFSGQQWDAPNGWAPLQWIAYKGLRNYAFDSADQLKSNWIRVNSNVYQKTGKMTEKYEVWGDDGEGGGGEYPNQDGFGWTNGVFLAMTAS